MLLDTNVISEFMREDPSQVVRLWLDDQPSDELFTTAITESEIRTGIAFLPEGRKKRRLNSAAERAFDVVFSGRVLSFGSDAARAYAEIAAERRAVGRPIGHVDCQIAAIARSRGASIATRNVRDFEGCGVPIVDPWRT